MNIQFHTLAPSPHLVGVLDELHERGSVNLRVVYEKKRLDGRSWGVHPGEAPHTYLDSWDVTGHGQHIAPGLWREVGEAMPDVVVVNTSYVSPNTYALVQLLRHRDVPFVFWTERVSCLSHPVVKQMRRPILRWILRHASGLVGSTRATIHFYRSTLGYEGPATWVPYHRDLTPFLEVAPLSAPRERTRFLMLGALIHRKGIDTVLRALDGIEEPAEIIIAGDGPERSRLEAMAKACRPPHRVQFLGSVSYDRVPEIMRDGEVLLFPSRHDGFGMATIEALAAGRPVVASGAVMSARQYIQPDVNGWVLPTDAPSVWRRRIEAIMGRRGQLPRWSRAARNTVCSEYDVEADVSRLLRLLEGILSSGASSRSAAQEQRQA